MSNSFNPQAKPFVPGQSSNQSSGATTPSQHSEGQNEISNRPKPSTASKLRPTAAEFTPSSSNNVNSQQSYGNHSRSSSLNSQHQQQQPQFINPQQQQAAAVAAYYYPAQAAAFNAAQLGYANPQTAVYIQVSNMNQAFQNYIGAYTAMQQIDVQASELQKLVALRPQADFNKELQELQAKKANCLAVMQTIAASYAPCRFPDMLQQQAAAQEAATRISQPNQTPQQYEQWAQLKTAAETNFHHLMKQAHTYIQTMVLGASQPSQQPQQSQPQMNGQTQRTSISKPAAGETNTENVSPSHSIPVESPAEPGAQTSQPVVQTEQKPASPMKDAAATETTSPKPLVVSAEELAKREAEKSEPVMTEKQAYRPPATKAEASPLVSGLPSSTSFKPRVGAGARVRKLKTEGEESFIAPAPRVSSGSPALSARQNRTATPTLSASTPKSSPTSEAVQSAVVDPMSSEFRRYTAEFIRSLENSPLSMEKLTNLPEIAELILISRDTASLTPSHARNESGDKWRAPAAAPQRRRESGVRPQSASRGGMNQNDKFNQPRDQRDRNDRDLGRDLSRSAMGTGMLPPKHEKRGSNSRQPKKQQEQPMDIDVKPLERTENAYVVKKPVEPDAKLLRAINSILNKLTPEKFDILLEQVVKLEISTVDQLRDVVTAIFEKALAEPNFAHVYAEFCVKLNGRLPSFDDTAESAQSTQKKTISSFKRILLSFCQAEFEKKIDESDEEIKAKAKRRTLAAIRFIGELFIRQMVVSAVIKRCVVVLFGDEKNPIETDLEALCKLLETVGQTLAHNPSNADFLDVVFQSITKLSQNKSLSSRVRFMLQDVIDLRARGWIVKRKIEVAKTIQEIHAEEQKKQMEAEAERQREALRQRGSFNRPPNRPFAMPSAAGRRVGPSPGLASQLQMSDWQTVPAGKKSREPSQDIRGSTLSAINAAAPGAKSPSRPTTPGLSRSNSQAGLEAEIGQVQNQFDALEIEPQAGEQTETAIENEEHHQKDQKPAVKKRSDEDVVKEIQSLTKEYFTAEDLKEVENRVRELGNENIDVRLVTVPIELVLDLKEKQREMLPNIFIHLHFKDILSTDLIIGGFESLWPNTSADALGCDFPLCVPQISNILGHLIAAKIVPITYLNSLNLMKHFSEGSNAVEDVIKVATSSLVSAKKNFANESEFVELVKSSTSGQWNLKQLFEPKFHTTDAIKKYLSDKRLEFLQDLIQ